MTPPLLGIGEEEGKSNVTLLVSSSVTMESVCHKTLELKERNYMGLSDCSSVDSSVPSFSEETKSNLNLKATELRLGLPGSQSPERDSDLCLRSSTQFDEKPLFPLRPLTDDHHSSTKTAVLGNKRGFSDAMNGFSEVNTNWYLLFKCLLNQTLKIPKKIMQGKFLVDSEANPMLSPRPPSNLGLNAGSTLEKAGAQQNKMKEAATAKVGLDKSPHSANETRPSIDCSANNNNSAPATK